MSNLLKAIKEASEKDLEEIQGQIIKQEDELATLRRAERLLLTKFGKTPKTKPGPKSKEKPEEKAPFDMYAVRRRVAQFLSDGPQNGQQIMLHCKIGGPKFTEVMNYEWFVKVEKGYQLTTLGRKYGVEEE